jgi:LPXTG-site transpeptidase (sortase) family protein
MQEGGRLILMRSWRGRHAAVLSIAALAFVLVLLACSGCDGSAKAQPTESPRVFPEEVADSARAWEMDLLDDPTLEVCHIVIPRIGVDAAVVEGTAPADLERGPGHWPETPLPGRNGRVVISGHRTIFGSPFLRLNELQTGDSIRLVLPYGVAEYEVTETEIVGPQEVDKVAQRGREELSLATCHPPGSGEFRLLVHARAVGFSATP